MAKQAQPRSLFPVKELHIRFEYDLPKEVVRAWWTDLTGKGYVGKRLKSIKPIGKEEDKTRVETKWSIMGMTMTLVEKLTLTSDYRWTWEPHLLGIHIRDDFRVDEATDGKTRLSIDSTIVPKGMRGKLMHLLVGGKLNEMMVDEWQSTSKAFLDENTARPLAGS